MATALVKPGRELAKQLLMIEISVVVFSAVGMSLTINTDWGFAALIGGGIFVVANAVFSGCAFLFCGARATKLVAASFYAGEALKILITVLLFSLVFMYMQVELVPLKLTYLLVLGVNIFAPVLFINNPK